MPKKSVQRKQKQIEKRINGNHREANRSPRFTRNVKRFLSLEIDSVKSVRFPLTRPRSRAEYHGGGITPAAYLRTANTFLPPPQSNYPCGSIELQSTVRRWRERVRNRSGHFRVRDRKDSIRMVRRTDSPPPHPSVRCYAVTTRRRDAAEKRVRRVYRSRLAAVFVCRRAHGSPGRTRTLSERKRFWWYYAYR